MLMVTRDTRIDKVCLLFILTCIRTLSVTVPLPELIKLLTCHPFIVILDCQGVCASKFYAPSVQTCVEANFLLCNSVI